MDKSHVHFFETVRSAKKFDENMKDTDFSQCL